MGCLSYTQGIVLHFFSKFQNLNKQTITETLNQFLN
uniref:Uncharacterized protein n=1 Tax=Rhizophora mucronata TaxID=61149 RepID=A0A2P2QHD3_RHIMU